MVCFATDLEIEISEATGKSVTMVRYYTSRMLLELILGRNLNKKEAAKMKSKVANSSPRNSHGPGYIHFGEESEPDWKGANEILKILDRTKILDVVK